MSIAECVSTYLSNSHAAFASHESNLALLGNDSCLATYLSQMKTENARHDGVMEGLSDEAAIITEMQLHLTNIQAIYQQYLQCAGSGVDQNILAQMQAYMDTCNGLYQTCKNCMAANGGGS